MKDLGLDSLDQVEIIMAMEDEFGNGARGCRGRPGRGSSGTAGLCRVGQGETHRASTESRANHTEPSVSWAAAPAAVGNAPRPFAPELGPFGSRNSLPPAMGTTWGRGEGSGEQWVLSLVSQIKNPRQCRLLFSLEFFSSSILNPTREKKGVFSLSVYIPNFFLLPFGLLHASL